MSPADVKHQQLELIRKLNDRLIYFRIGGQVVITVGIRSKGEQFISKVFEALDSYKGFNNDNDPYGEHDFVSLSIEGERVFAKIDYYDLNMQFASEAPWDEKQTKRVMAIMLACEY